MAKRWTKIEDNYILAKVAENPHNISKTLVDVAFKLNRGVPGTRFRYYTISKSNSSICLVNLGKKSILINRKITREDTTIEPVTTRQSIWQRVINIFKKDG